MPIDTDIPMSPQELEKQADFERAGKVIDKAIRMCEALKAAGLNVTKENFEYDPDEVYIPPGGLSNGVEYKFQAKQGDDFERNAVLGRDEMLSMHIWLPSDDRPGLRQAVISCRIEDEASDESLNMHIMKGKMSPPVSIDRKDPEWVSKSNEISQDEAIEQFGDMLLRIAQNMTERINHSRNEEAQRQILRIVEEMIGHQVIDPERLSDEDKDILAAARELLVQ